MIEEIGVVNELQPSSNREALYYILTDGTHIGFYDYDPPYPNAVVVPSPMSSDQVWDFETQTWGPSFFLDSNREKEWLTLEMALVAEQLLMLEDDDPLALPGTDRQWRDYRIKLRAWKEGNVDYPDQTKRPVRPT